MRSSQILTFKIIRINSDFALNTVFSFMFAHLNNSLHLFLTFPNKFFKKKNVGQLKNLHNTVGHFVFFIENPFLIFDSSQHSLFHKK